MQALTGDLDSVAIEVIGQGADLKELSDGKLPIYEATVCHGKSVVRLLDRGADVNLRNPKGKTALTPRTSITNLLTTMRVNLGQPLYSGNLAVRSLTGISHGDGLSASQSLTPCASYGISSYIGQANYERLVHSEATGVCLHFPPTSSIHRPQPSEIVRFE